MRHRLLSAFLLAAAILPPAAPVVAGDLLLPLSGGVAADGTTYATRVWVTNTGASTRRLTVTFIAPGADGTRAATGPSISVGPGATTLATGLAPAGQSGLLLLSGAPQLMVSSRLEATGKDGALRAAVAAPWVSGHQLAAAGRTLQLHGMSNKQGGLITDLYLINAARQTAQCSLDAFRFDGSRIAATLHLTLPALSVRVFERALDTLGATNVDETRFALSCDQSFYAYARVYKPGSGELNLMTPSPALGHQVTAAAARN
ncbi:MAG TPA: hypothetical protein VFE33_24140 [Thermoanaerobaculia bacterium]|nr:hypothetical protein [Thermoanaerobaculia bacterium]